jgi:hypothetical protein
MGLACQTVPPHASMQSESTSQDFWIVQYLSSALPTLGLDWGINTRLEADVGLQLAPATWQCLLKMHATTTTQCMWVHAKVCVRPYSATT